jgi:hypothetical protein
MLRVAGFEFKVNKSKLEHQGRLGNGQFFTPLESPAACSMDENYSFFSEHGG